MIKQTGKKQMVNGVELAVINPRRAPRGMRSDNRVWTVTTARNTYTIRGGSPGIGGCGTGFEVTTGMGKFAALNHGKFDSLKAALEYIASQSVSVAV